MLNRLLLTIVSGLFALTLVLPATAAGVDMPAQESAVSRANGGPVASRSNRTSSSEPAPVQESEVVPALAPVTQPQQADYAANRNSEVFGANLFSGAFAREGASQFSPDYAIAIGDRIQIRLWGAFVYDALLVVDPRGNIFLPHAGPVQVLGIRNQDLQRTVDGALARAFRSNVFSYASLAAAQPVRIFVGGFVNRPGLYNGTSLDSVLHYLDQAGGIDTERGSFLNVQVKRGQKTRATANLYEFLLDGSMPQIQLADGDVIFVGPRQNTVKVDGLTENARRFEFSDSARTVGDLIKLARPRATATHIRVTRNTGAVKNIEYYPLADASRVTLQNGDELVFTSDKKPGSITVRVEGEHLSRQEYVLPYGSKLGELLQQIQFSERSDKDSLQLFRMSVRERQKQMLQTSLRSLETTALTARSGTSDEARLRQDEADLLLRWVDRARKIEPSGQVVIAHSNSQHLLLESGDVIRVPVKDDLVLVGGEVLFPNSLVFDRQFAVDDYVRRAGGYTQNADAARIVVAHRDGSFTDIRARSGVFSFARDVAIRPGDEILVLPKIDIKSRQIWKDMTQIIYQIAVSAKVVLGL